VQVGRVDDGPDGQVARSQAGLAVWSRAVFGVTWTIDGRSSVEPLVGRVERRHYDVVFSRTVPGLATIPARVAGLLPRLAREGNYIHGVHPAALVAAVRDDPGLGRRLLGLEAAPLGRRRLHARLGRRDEV
jgi:hypothetical protein